MAMTNHSWEEQTKKLLEDTISELKNVEVDKQRLEHSIATLAKRKEAYEIVLQDYRKRVVKEDTKPDWTNLLNGRTQKEMLQIIAQQQGGKLKVSQASHILFSGFTKATKYATVYQMVQGMLTELTEKHIFEKTAPGEFKLVEPSLSNWETEEK